MPRKRSKVCFRCGATTSLQNCGDLNGACGDCGQCSCLRRHPDYQPPAG